MEKSDKEKRILWIDYARAFAIIGVLIVHTQIQEIVIKDIFMGLIPLFFFLSGLFTTRFNVGWKTFFRNEWKHLLLPYCAFGIFYLFFWAFVSRHFGNAKDAHYTVGYAFLGLLNGNWSGLVVYAPLWFVPCLFVAETYYFFINKISSKIMRVCAYGIACLWLVVGSVWHFELPFGSVPAMVMLAFFCLGDSVSKYIKRPSLPAYVLVIIAITIVAILAYTSTLNDVTVLVGISAYGCVPLFLVNAALSILLVIAVCQLLERIPCHFKLLTFFGQNTLSIMLTHLTVYSFIKAICVFIFHQSLDLFDTSVGVAILLVGTLLIEVPLCCVINRYVPFLVGKKK